MKTANHVAAGTSTIEVIDEGLRESAAIIQGCMADIEAQDSPQEVKAEFRIKAKAALKRIAEARAMLVKGGKDEE